MFGIADLRNSRPESSHFTMYLIYVMFLTAAKPVLQTDIKCCLRGRLLPPNLSKLCCAASLKVIDNEGLRGYIDVECLQNELSDVTGMTAHELDEAAHQLLISKTPGALPSSTATESDAASDESWLPGNARRSGELYEYEFTI